MKRKITFIILLAILATLLFGVLYHRKYDHTLTDLGPLDDPVCIQSIRSDNGFPLPWQKGVLTCSENDAHSEIGTYDHGEFSPTAFLLDILFFTLPLGLLALFPALLSKQSRKS